ncbi:G-protein beta WD-40 repeat-containing protein [Artemisia annua]|uniref:G-protein beta WD-40 repeat-containing protein n=1 Tax=Artemisia annua TaxID=35608 RepID=A0A2U1LP96_ARTAN|nr:G-protein beta WD-40 repeat-containing protein [Artemisia annua]
MAILGKKSMLFLLATTLLICSSYADDHLSSAGLEERAFVSKLLQIIAPPMRSEWPERTKKRLEFFKEGNDAITALCLKKYCSFHQKCPGNLCVYELLSNKPINCKEYCSEERSLKIPCYYDYNSGGNRSEFCSDITSPLSDPGAFPRLMEHFSFQLSMGHLPWYAFCRDSRIVPRAAATEIELARKLKEFSFTETGLLVLFHINRLHFLLGCPNEETLNYFISHIRLTKQGHKNWITGISWEPVHLQSPCHRFVTSSKDGDARIWDATMRKTLIVLSGHTLAVTTVIWSVYRVNLVPNYNYMVCLLPVLRRTYLICCFPVSQDCTIKVWETTQGKLIRELKGHGHWVNSLALSTEYVLRTGAFDHMRKHYSSPEEMKEAALERYNKMKGNALERLVSGSDDFTMFLWEPSLVNHVYFSPDGQWIASASFDKSVKLWNGITRKFVCALQGHVGPVYQIRFPSFGEEYLTILFQSIREECETMQADS